MRIRAIACLVVAACLILSPAARGLVIAKEDVDAEVRSMMAGEWVKGLVVGVLDETGQHVYGYGTVGPSGKAPDGDSVFEVGSITKLFVATLLQQMADKNELTLTTPVAALLDPDVKVPSDSGAKILLIHLASHTSGLPLSPPDFVPHDPINPYADYTTRQLNDSLRRATLMRAPGDKFEYSNFGYAVLGEALANKGKKDVESLINERICTPLAMKDTHMALTESMKPRFIPGYDVEGEPVPPWTMQAMAPALGLKSTANDLLKFAAASVGVTRGPLLQTLRATHERQADADASNDIAVGWQVERRYQTIWHNGQTGGYHAFLACSPRQKTAVVLLANGATPVVDMVGINLGKKIAGQHTNPLEFRASIKLPTDVLDDFVGEYRFAPTVSIVITREGSQLFAQTTGQEKLRLYAMGPSSYFYKKVNTTLVFDRAPNGQITGMTLHSGPNEAPAKKVK